MKKILVPFDFSKSSHNALEFAFSFAASLGSELVILHVLNTHHHLFKHEEHLKAMEASLHAREKKYHTAFESLEDAGNSRGIKIHSEIFRHATVHAGIVEFIRKEGFDMVVMGSQGSDNPMLGGVAEKVLKLSPIPVLLVPEDWGKRAVHKILVPVDFSEGSRRATGLVSGMAKDLQADLTFLIVIEEDDYPDIFNEYFYFDKEENQFLKREILKSLSDFVGIPGDRAEFEVRAGHPYHEIREIVSERSIDLIAIPTTGQYLYDKILIGSTTDRILRTAPCPVVTVPFLTRNTGKAEYHVKFTEFMAGYKFGHGRTELD